MGVVVLQVVLAQLADGTVTAGAFVLPNAPISPNKALVDFIVPLPTLEASSGIQFFPEGSLENLPSPAEGALVDQRKLPHHLDAVQHLCTRFSCELPPPEFWNKDRKPSVERIETATNE
jgi:hypothetical protein